MEFLHYGYYINLDERGEFYADVRDPTGKTVFEIHGFEIFEDGFMSSKEDLSGLQEYLGDLGVISLDATIHDMSAFEDLSLVNGFSLNEADIAGIGEAVVEMARRGLLSDDDQWFLYPGAFDADAGRDRGNWTLALDKPVLCGLNVREAGKGSWMDVYASPVYGKGRETDTGRWCYLGSIDPGNPETHKLNQCSSCQF